MATVYILYSSKIDKYYIGSCKNLESRLKMHFEGKFSKAYTKNTDDWIVYFQFDHEDIEVVRKIEAHIKRMKSRIYIENLIRFPEMIEKLILKYS